MSHSPTLFSSDDECSTPCQEKDLRKKLQTLLQGVPPPSSITISKFSPEEILFKYKENEINFKCCTNPDDSFSSQRKNYNLTLLANNSDVSEDIASLSQKVQERYIQLETMSSCNIWFQSSIPLSGSAKKRSRLKQRIGLSPGRRLSHLARRKQIFSCANLQRMADMDKKRHIEIKKNGIYQDKRPDKSTYLEKLNTSKRALFLSPDDGANHSKHVKEFPKRKLFGSSEKKKKIPLKENSKRSEVRRWLFEQNFNGNTQVSKKRLRDENYDQVPGRKAKCPRRSLTFQDEDESSRSPGLSSTHSSISLPALSQNHKNKLLWAVSVALKEADVTRKDPNFKKCASSLFMTCRKNLNKILSSQIESTSEKMLHFARESIPSLLDKLGMGKSKPNRNVLTPVKQNQNDLNESVQSESDVVFKTPIKFIRVKKSKTCDNKIRLKGVVVRCKSLESLENLDKKTPEKKIVKKLFDCDVNNSTFVESGEVTLLNESDVDLASQTLAPSSVNDEGEGFSLLDGLKKSEKNETADDESVVDSEESHEIGDQEFKGKEVLEGPTRIEESEEEEDLFEEDEKVDGNDSSVTFSLIYEQPDPTEDKPEAEEIENVSKEKILNDEKFVDEDGKSEDEVISSDVEEESKNGMKEVVDKENELRDAIVEEEPENLNETEEAAIVRNDVNDQADDKESKEETKEAEVLENEENIVEANKKVADEESETIISLNEAKEAEQEVEAPETLMKLTENATETNDIDQNGVESENIPSLKDAVIEPAIVSEEVEANDTANMMSLDETANEGSNDENISAKNDEAVSPITMMNLNESAKMMSLDEMANEEDIAVKNDEATSPIATTSNSEPFVAPEPYVPEANDSEVCDDSILPSQTSTPILSPNSKTKGRKLRVKKSKKNWKIVEEESDDDIPLSDLRNLKLKVRLSHEWEVISKNYSTSDLENSNRQNNTEEQSTQNTFEESDSSVDSSEEKLKQLLEEKNFVEIEPSTEEQSSLNTSDESVDVENVADENLPQEDDVAVDPSYERLKQLLEEKNFVEIKPEPFVKEEEKTPEKEYVCEDQNPLTYTPIDELKEENVDCDPAFAESITFSPPLKEEILMSDDEQKPCSSTFTDTCSTVDHEALKEMIGRDEPKKEENIYVTPGKRAASPLLNFSHKKRVLSLENYKARKQLEKESAPDDLEGISPLKSDESEGTPPKKIYNITLKRPEDRHKHKRRKEKSHDRHKHEIKEVKKEQESSEHEEEGVDSTRVQAMFSALTAISAVLEQQIKCATEKPGSVLQEDIVRNFGTITKINDAINKELGEWMKRAENADISKKWTEVLSTFVANNPVLKHGLQEKFARSEGSVEKEKVKCENAEMKQFPQKQNGEVETPPQQSHRVHQPKHVARKSTMEPAQRDHSEMENVVYRPMMEQMAPKAHTSELTHHKQMQIRNHHKAENVVHQVMAEQTPPREVVQINHVEIMPRGPLMEQTPPNKVFNAQPKYVARGPVMEQTPPRQVRKDLSWNHDNVAHRPMLEQTPPKEILQIHPMNVLHRPMMVQTPPQVETPPKQFLPIHQPQIVPTNSLYRPYEESTPPRPQVIAPIPQQVAIIHPYVHDVSYQNEQTPPKQMLHVSQPPPLMSQPLKSPYSCNTNSLHKQAVERWHEQNTQNHAAQYQPTSKRPLLQGNPGFANYNYPQKSFQSVSPGCYAASSPPHPPPNPRKILSGTPGFSNFNPPREIYRSPHYPEFHSPDRNHFNYYNPPTYHSPDNYSYGREEATTTTTTSSSAFHSISPNGHYNSYSPWNSPTLVNNSNYHQQSPVVKPLRRSLVPQMHDAPYYGNC